VGDVVAEALVNKMHLSLAEVKAQTPVDTLHYLGTKESANTPADRVAEVKGDKVGETLTDVKSASPV